MIFLDRFCSIWQFKTVTEQAMVARSSAFIEKWFSNTYHCIIGALFNWWCHSIDVVCNPQRQGIEKE